MILVLAWLLDPAGDRPYVLLVLLGFALGWTSATIARWVYPPPKKYRRGVGTAP